MRKYVLVSLSALTLNSAVLANSALEREILQLDQKLFAAFNSCDLTTMGELLSPELEFYHDKGGLTDYAQTMKSTKANCDAKLGLTRTLLPDTNHVYPITDYGAIQEAQHQFCHVKNTQLDCGTFKFVHIWQQQQGRWQITRVISYDH